MNADEPIDITFLFDQSYHVDSKPETKSTSLNDLLEQNFSFNLIPFNHITQDLEKEKDESIINLYKFKELNLNKVKEDMIYYCSPVDILSKLDKNKGEYIYQESDSEFFNDLSIKTFLQRQNQLKSLLNDDDVYKIDILEKAKKLDNWNYSFKKEENKYSSKENDKLNEINHILKNIQKTIKLFLIEKKIDILLNSLNEIVSDLNKEKIEIEYIGYELYIILEKNLAFLLGIIEKKFCKDEETMSKFIGTFIDMAKYLKSNRLLFKLIQILSVYKIIPNQVKFDKNQQMISDESIDLKKIIKDMDIYLKINIKDLKEFNHSKGYEINEKSRLSDDEIWTVHNKEELFIFSNSPSQKNLYFYKINIREEELITEDTFEMIDFGEIILSNKEDDIIFNINISIKNDLIYICYLVNQKLNNGDEAQFKFDFSLFYKLYSTSMILLKEGLIKLDHFDCLNSYLYSDQEYFYVISDNNKLFTLKKNYLMDNYKYSKYRLNKNSEYISINDYKFHNCFNLNNFIILENKKDIEDLLLAEFSKDNDEYILNITIMNTLKKRICQEETTKFKISYNEDIFLVIKIVLNCIYLSIPNFNINIFIGKGIQFLPFDNNYNYNVNINNDYIYTNLLKEYSTFVNLYGNFDLIDNNSENILLSYPYYFCFNINLNNLNFIIDQIISKEQKMETKIYYINIVKQYICCLYNTDCLKIEQINKLIEFMKKYILDININYKDNNNKKYIHKVLKEIIYISSYLRSTNIIEIQDIKNIINKNKEIIYKTKFLLLDLLLTQSKTQQNPELFNFILEIDKNFLLNILTEEKDKNKKMKLLFSNYKIYKIVMNKVLVLIDNYYKKDLKKNGKEDLQLFDFTEKITKNIEQICKLYQKVYDTEICSVPIFFFSINFSLLYLILQKLIINDSLNKDMKIFSSLYNLLLIFDKLNINKNIEKSFDLNNVIEIKNSSIENEGNSEKKEQIKNIINFNSTQNIIFKNNLADIDFNDYMKIKLIKKDKKEFVELNLNEIYDYIHYNVDEIEVTFNKVTKTNNQFILNVIPLKDEKLYLKYRNNENRRIINLLQKTILHYFLYLFENVDELINNFIKKKEIKNFCKLYLTDFLQFINTKNIDINLSIFDKKKEKEEEKEKKDEDNEEEENIISLTDELINGINKSFNYSKNDNDNKNNKSPIQGLNEQFITLFEKINNNEKNNYYKKDEKSLQKILSYKDINFSDSSFSKLFQQFESDISKKNKLLSSIQSNDLINKMIIKLFQIIIKYYNYNNKLFDLMDNFKNITTNENYKLLRNIYEECCQMRIVYNHEKSRFIDEKFEEQSKNYIDITNAKLDFIYKIIIPSFDEGLKYDKSIIKSLIDLIKNKNFSPQEIIKYSEIQNLNCIIKNIELLIINNLLINLNEEDNLKFILYEINDKYNKSSIKDNYSISISLFDSIYGADFLQMEKIKNQFHLLIEIIIDKYILNNKNYDNLSITTKIALYQSLLWKYKGRDFQILPKIIKCFEDMKNYELIDKNNKNILFKLDHEKVYRITNYNIETFRNIKFEIFKIITSQIFMKIKDNLNYGNIKLIDNSLNLTRNISNIKDYKDIICLVISYFTFVKNNNKYYNEFILFFYKNIINSQKLIELLLESYPEVIIKILDIIFETKENINQNINTKLIILKLFLQILENINNDDQIAILIDCCMQYNNNEVNANDKNEEFYPFEFLISKFNNLLNNEENEFLKYYYFKIFLFCLNKIDLKKSKIDKNNLLNINLILSSNYNLSQIESKFYIKNDYGNEFEENALFCHLESNKIPKSGNLLCFIDNDSLFNKYLTQNDITYFNYNDFNYNVEQKKNTENIFVIMDESLDGKINKINTIEKRNIKDITLIDNKKNNSFYANYLENNSDYIYENLISKLFENKLNYKGINYILKMIYNLLDYIKIENAKKILKYIFQYINDKNVIKNEKEWDFCSLEYFINEMNSFQNIFDNSSFNIFNENKKEENENKMIQNVSNMESPLLLSSLFNYIIKDNNDFCIEYKSNNTLKKNFSNKLNQLNKNEVKTDNDSQLIKMTNLSFYKSHTINSFTKINENSLLLIEKLTFDKELKNILDTNKEKIKAIFVSEKVQNIKDNEFKDFINNFNIPIYLIKKEFYKKIIEFFIEGKGGEYIPSLENNISLDPEIISIYKPVMLLNNNKKRYGLKDDIDSDQYNFYTSEDDFCLNSLYGTNNNSEDLNDNEKKEKINEFQKNIEKKYIDINFNLDKVYCLENIKLCYRMLYELLSKKNIINQLNKEDLNKNLAQIIEIFELLCKEYYFNITKKFPISNIQILLKKYMKSLNKTNTFSQKWIQCLMNNFVKSKNNNDDLMCKEYDKLLYIFKECNDLLTDEQSVNIFFDMMNDIIEKSIINIDKNNINKENKLRVNVPIENINNFIIKINNNKVFKSEFISYFLYQITNGIYETIINNKCNSKLLIKSFINNNHNNSIIRFIDEIIEIKKYLTNESNSIPKGKTLLVQFGLNYLDICFYIFFKEKQYDLINYWLKSNNDLFLFYSSYKILSTQKHYEEIDFKELLSIIAYISDSIGCFNEDIIKNKKDEKENNIFKMKMNNFNKLNLKKENDINYTKITSFSFNDLKSINKNDMNYNKLAIFIYNKKTKKYSLQDIIDTSVSSDLKQNLINYKQLFNVEEIYLVPLNNVITSLYAFGNNFNHALGINGKLAKFYDKPTKCEGLPKNVWHIGYGNNYCLALSEDDKQIYACGCNKGGGFNSTPRASFTNETRINNLEENVQKYKFYNFATGNCDSSLLIDEKGELYGIGNNEMNIFGLDDKKLKYPTKLDLKIYEKKNKDNNNNEVKEQMKIGKIKSFYIGFNNCYIINEEGKLFGLGSNISFQISDEDTETYYQWKNIPLPQNCTKFVDCAVGEKYIICLVEDINGNNKLYAQGNNEKNQCGIITEPNGEPIKHLTMCENTNNLSFKKIYTRNSQSAAISIEGDLYIWGQTDFNNDREIFNTPTLMLLDGNNNYLKKDNNNINTEENKINENKINVINEELSFKNNKTIVDEIAICKSHLLIIARKYENGEYIRKLLGFGDNSKGALGLPMNTNKSEIKKYVEEIPLFNEKKEKLIPMKLTIGDNKSYILCVNENELIQEINNSKKKDEQDCYINISNLYIRKIGKDLLDFYNSKNLFKFINLFRTITNKALSEFIEAMDEIKICIQDEKEKEIIIAFQDFFNYIKKHEASSEINRIFVQSESNNTTININEKQELKSIYNYLKTKTKYITEEIFKYCSTNEKSEYKSFLQKAIGSNISYLSAERRLQKFNELLSKRIQKRGTDKRVEVDRFKANIFYDKFNEDPKNQVPDLEFNKTIFGQVYQTFGKISGEDFFIQKGKRLFIVCLKNEYASDSGGPYHEVIYGMCSELQSDYLNMFIKTPNNKHDIGLLRDKYIPNPEATREINEKTYEFLGKIMASCITSGEALDLNLHPVVWKALLGNEISFYEYENIDYTFYNLINNLEKELKSYDENKNNSEEFEDLYQLNFVIKNSNENDIILKPDGDKIHVTLDNLKEYITLSKKMRVNEFITQIEYIKNGFNSVIPSSIFQVLNWRQLEEMVCGKTKLDIQDLKKHTKYEGFREKDEIIKWFWEWLEECDDHEQSLYLKFVSGRARLPKEKNFKYDHIIVKNDYNNNEALPHSATCFFTLKLPMYKDKETLKRKLKYSILNCDEIDGDH